MGFARGVSSVVQDALEVLTEIGIVVDDEDICGRP
jgi:hypothetical protein